MLNFLPLILFLGSSQLLKSWPIAFYIATITSIVVFIIAITKKSFQLNIILLASIPYFTICALAIYFDIEPIYQFFNNFNAALFFTFLLLAYLFIPFFPASLKKLIMPIPFARVPFIVGLLIIITVAFFLRNYTPIFYGALVLALYLILKKFFPSDSETSTTDTIMKNIAPNILRQRFLIEGFYTINVTKEVIDEYLRQLASELNLRIYSDPIIFAPASGMGKEANSGFDAFVPLIDSGISLYVWSSSKFLSVMIYTCKKFDEAAALKFTKQFFKIEGATAELAF